MASFAVNASWHGDADDADVISDTLQEQVEGAPFIVDPVNLFAAVSSLGNDYDARSGNVASTSQRDSSARMTSTSSTMPPNARHGNDITEHEYPHDLKTKSVVMLLIELSL